MKVYVSLFGSNNYAWPRCLSENVVLTVVDNDLVPFWLAKDREGFINFCLKNKKTERGNIPNKQTASRWYGLILNIEETEDDYWIHRNDDEVWWTKSSHNGFDFILDDLRHPKSGVNEYIFRKSCAPWSNRDTKGNPLRWSNLHPKARNILSTQSTQITLSDENREYVLALLNGDSLQRWHDLKDWREVLSKASNAASVGRIYNARERTIWRIVAGVKATVAQANGQIVERAVKNKNLLLSDDELKIAIDELLDDQDGLCSISGIPLQLDGEETDKQLLCSLDRIDSSGHYERGNLQLLCRFVNKWKSADSDGEVRRLMAIVKSTSQI